METDISSRFSPSKLGTYKECPRRYRYRYIDRIKRDYRTAEAFLGECAHKAFEFLYTDLLHGRIATLEEVQREFLGAWERGASPDIVIHNPRYSLEDFKKAGQDCVSAYYRTHHPFARDKTVAVEKRIGFNLEAGGKEYHIEGFIDRLALGADGAFEIHDYKTGLSLPTQEELDSDWQLALYEMAVRRAWPETKETRLVWHYVRHGRTLISRRSEEQRRDLRARVADLIMGIKADHEFAPKAGPLCDWCEYRDICPLWAHGEKIKALPAGELKREDGARLVDELFDLEARKRALKDSLHELEAKQDAAEADLWRYAQSQGISVVFGGAGEAVLTQKEDYKLPTKTHAPQEWEALQNRLKGTPLWPEISQIDGPGFLKAYKLKQWAPEWLSLAGELLSRYALRLTQKNVRLRRKKAEEE